MLFKFTAEMIIRRKDAGSQEERNHPRNDGERDADSHTQIPHSTPTQSVSNESENHNEDDNTHNQAAPSQKAQP